ncbi:MAG: hypothetical protein IKK00_07370 [Oscillospiraceae bacterium]|nr:hypothetical protein [Oscillospiraceae bacterium]
MFDPGTKRAWQSITPTPELKQRALQPTQKKIVRFPGGNLVKIIGPMAACLILVLALLQFGGKPELLVNGQSIGDGLSLQPPVAMSRAMTQGFSLLLETEAALEVSGGTLEKQDSGTLWTVDSPGEYTLRSIYKNRSHTYTLQYSAETGLWTLYPGE